MTYTTTPHTRKGRTRRLLPKALCALFPPEYCVHKSPPDGLCCDTSCIRALHDAIKQRQATLDGTDSAATNTDKTGRKQPTPAGDTSSSKEVYPSFNLMRSLMYRKADQHPKDVAECYLTDCADNMKDQQAPSYGFEWDDTKSKYEFVNKRELLSAITRRRDPHFATRQDIGTFIEHTKSTATPV